MRCSVASDDIALAHEIRDLLIQLGHDCPASRILRVEQIVPAIDAILRSSPAGGGPAAADSVPEIVLVVLPPNPELALLVVHALRRRIGAGILAVGSTGDTKLVLRALREGASEYLDQSDLRSELSGAIARRGTSENVGPVIAVLTPGGGSGGSTIASNVAVALAQKYSGCALFDMNLETGDMAPLLDLKPAYTLTDLCQNADRLDLSLLQGCLVRHSSGLQLLAAPARISDAARITPAAIELVLSLAVRHFPFVVVDLDHSYRPEQQAAMRQANILVLVMRLDFISLRNTRRTLDFFQEIGILRERVRIVANRCGQSGEITAAQVEESLGLKIAHFIPEDQRAVTRASNNGVPVVLESPSAKVSRALVELATNLAASKPAGG
ncbi:MAG TPA: P-loop NTPase [Pirellulaceae bacterium]|nr:P-loop NTPase [Pirellulaceae bacterium]